MATITFDMLALVDKLKTAGFDQKQAETVIRVIADAQGELATKDYIDLKFQQELSPIKTDLAVLKWMMGILIAGILSLVVKAFI
ncbi:MAG: hypothetical protein RLZZ419_514 [Pseudomonadota bacterium]|jgi:hypothetical protein